MKTIKFSALTIAYLLFSTFCLFAQYEKEWLQNLGTEDQQHLEAIAMYPLETRMDILEITQYPQLVIKLKRIQAQTKDSFQQLLESYTEEEQKAIWDLTRYPGLIERFVEANSAKERDQVLSDYPKVIHQRAKFVAREFPDVLVAIIDLQKSIQNTTEAIIATYPEKTASAIERLVELPEVLTLLGKHLELTMLLGDIYLKDTAWVLHQIDSINLELARSNTKELENWTNSFGNNPEAGSEMEQVAKDFEETYGYDDEYYSEYSDDIYYDETDNDEYVIEHHYYHHYPYWFGYPTWYSYPRWRPFPWWIEWGFYIRPHYGLFITGLPSHFCINWYFDLGYHHYYYPHFSAHLVAHYYRHPRGHSPIAHGVYRWRNQHQSIITEPWLQKKQGRVERFKELGRFEKDRLAFNKKHSKNQLSQEEFLSKNQSQYNRLEYKSKVVRPKNEIKRAPIPKTKLPANITKKKQPRTNIPKSTKPTIKRPTKKSTKPTITRPPKAKIKSNPRVIKPKRKPTIKSKVKKPTIRKKSKPNIPAIKRSKDFHTKSWNKKKKKN